MGPVTRGRDGTQTRLHQRARREIHFLHVRGGCDHHRATTLASSTCETLCQLARRQLICSLHMRGGRSRCAQGVCHTQTYSDHWQWKSGTMAWSIHPWPKLCKFKLRPQVRIKCSRTRTSHTGRLDEFCGPISEIFNLVLTSKKCPSSNRIHMRTSGDL